MALSTPDAAARRTRYIAQTAVLAAAATIVLIFIVALSARLGWRADLTATRQHTLSPRTLALLRSLDAPTEIIVAAGRARTDPRTRQQIDDLLASFAGASPRLTVRTIDPASPAAQADIESLIRSLAQRHEHAVSRQRAALDDTARDLAALAAASSEAASQLEANAAQAPQGTSRQRLADLAALLRAMPGDLSRAAEGVADAAARPIAGAALPVADEAQQAALPALDAMAKAAEAASAAARDAGLSPPPSLNTLRDAALSTADRLRRLGPLEPLMVARLLASREAVIVLSDKGLTAVEYQSLLPVARAGDSAAARAQMLFVGEEAIAGAIATLASPVTPIVVFVHAEREAMLDAARRPTAATSARIGRLIQRLELRRFSISEWPVARMALRPDLASIDPQRQRPVVWFIMGAPSRLGGTQRENDRPARLDALARAQAVLIENGEDLLIAVEPSELPAVGERDPLVAPLEPLGLRIDSARPLIELVSAPGVTAVSSHQTLREANSRHPIGAAVNGLAMMLQWASIITLDADIETDDRRLTPLLTVPAGDRRWGESQWLGLRYLHLGRPFQAVIPRELPTPDERRDNLTGPWVVGAAAERFNPPSRRTPGSQRLVVVAAPSWFEDQFADASTTVDGRSVALMPGNPEFVDAALLWLAHQDELIAASPRPRDTPRVGMIPPARLTAIRWALIAGLPLLTLGIGAVALLLRRA